MRKLSMILLLACLAGCATGQSLPGLGGLPNLNLKLKDKTLADLDTAITEAQKATDIEAPQRVICYTTIKGIVENITVPAVTIPKPGKGTGVFTVFESAAQVAEGIDVVGNFSFTRQERVDLANSCGPLQVRGRGIFARLLLKFGIGG